MAEGVPPPVLKDSREFEIEESFRLGYHRWKRITFFSSCSIVLFLFISFVLMIPPMVALGFYGVGVFITFGVGIFLWWKTFSWLEGKYFPCPACKKTARWAAHAKTFTCSSCGEVFSQP